MGSPCMHAALDYAYLNVIEDSEGQIKTCQTPQRSIAFTEAEEMVMGQCVPELGATRGATLNLPSPPSISTSTPRVKLELSPLLRIPLTKTPPTVATSSSAMEGLDLELASPCSKLGSKQGLDMLSAVSEVLSIASDGAFTNGPLLADVAAQRDVAFDELNSADDTTEEIFYESTVEPMLPIPPLAFPHSTLRYPSYTIESDVSGIMPFCNDACITSSLLVGAYAALPQDFVGPARPAADTKGSAIMAEPDVDKVVPALTLPATNNFPAAASAFIDDSDVCDVFLPAPMVVTAAVVANNKPSWSRAASRCGICVGCTHDKLHEDCRTCENCRDKKKFGGQGKKRKGCIERRCVAFFIKKSVYSKFL